MIAILLHCFFLSTFAWLFVQGLHIYRMQTEVRNVNFGAMRFYYAIGWGVPAIITGKSCLSYSHAKTASFQASFPMPWCCPWVSAGSEQWQSDGCCLPYWGEVIPYASPHGLFSGHGAPAVPGLVVKVFWFPKPACLGDLLVAVSACWAGLCQRCLEKDPDAGVCSPGSFHCGREA